MAYVILKKGKNLSATLLLTVVMCAVGTPAVHADSGSDSGGSSSYSSNDSSPMNEALIYLEQEDYQRAIDELNRFIKDEGETADALNLLGFSNRKLKNYDDAYDYYTRALEMDPDHIGATEYLGELYVETEQMDKAQTQLARLKEICPADCSEFQKLQDVINAANQ